MSSNNSFEISMSGRQYVLKIEKGKINLTLDYLGKIMSQLNCEPKDFFAPLN